MNSRISHSFIIRTILFLAIILFLVLGGNLLYTGYESATTISAYTNSVPLSEGVELKQAFIPTHKKLSTISVIIGKDQVTSGILHFQLYDKNNHLLYTKNVELSNTTDMWYIEMPVNKQLSTASTYTYCLSATDCGDAYPTVYLSSSQNKPQENITDSSTSLVTRFTYQILVLKRLVLILCLFVLFILGFLFVFLISSKKPHWFIPSTFLNIVPFGNTIRILDYGMFLVVTLVAIVIRYYFLPVRTWDYYYCYLSWINDIRACGGFASLQNNIGDYSPLYMLLLTALSYFNLSPGDTVKLLPLLFDFFLAIVALFTLNRLKKSSITHSLFLYALILLNPVVFLNSGAWGQCDSVYSVFLLLTLFFCMTPIKEKAESDLHHWHLELGDLIMICFSIGFSLKLQAIFLLPFLGLVLIKHQKQILRLTHFLWIPIVYVISCIPGFLMGRSLKVMLKVYLGQTDRDYNLLTLNYPNLYTLLGKNTSNLYDSYFIMGLFLTFTILLILFYGIYHSKKELTPILLIKISMITIFIICYFLPTVHERYAYFGELLLCILAIIDYKKIPILVITIFATVTTYISYIYEGDIAFAPVPDLIISLLRLVCLLLLLADLVISMKDNTNNDQELLKTNK